MSRAFVRESDGDESLPERPVSSEPNWVTPRGLAALETRLRELELERQAARERDDTALRARIERDLRYYSQRRASARLVDPGAATGQVRFGMRVTLESGAGTLHVFRIVGEDEADAAEGLLSWTSPLAKSLFGRAVGERVAFQGDEAAIVSIEP